MQYVMSNYFSFFLADALVGVWYTSHLSNIPMLMDGFDDGILTNIIHERLSRTQLFIFDSMK